MGDRIDARVGIGHVHLNVADLDRALAFYRDVLGFEVTHRTVGTAFLGAGGYHHHLALHRRNGSAGPHHFAIRYPDRAALGDAVRRVERAGVPLDGATDHGVAEAVYVRDPDEHRVELYWDRPQADWPRQADGSLRLDTRPLDLDAVRAAADRPEVPPADSPYAPMDTEVRAKLRGLRTHLLHLHKVLLDDTKAAYEMDRGRVPSNASLLQLVINDPWFAWLHALSELVVRIDQAIEYESPATGADATALVESVERLLTAQENGEGFARRYYEALQRQPAVVIAHAAVRRAVKEMKQV